MKHVRDAALSRKRGGNAESAPPPLPDPVLTMSERRSLGARAPSNRAVQVSASSQPPKKRLRTRNPVLTANPTDAAHPSWPNH